MEYGTVRTAQYRYVNRALPLPLRMKSCHESSTSRVQLEEVNAELVRSNIRNLRLIVSGLIKIYAPASQ